MVRCIRELRKIEGDCAACIGVAGMGFEGLDCVRAKLPWLKAPKPDEPPNISGRIRRVSIKYHIFFLLLPNINRLTFLSCFLCGLGKWARWIHWCFILIFPIHGRFVGSFLHLRDGTPDNRQMRNSRLMSRKRT